MYFKLGKKQRECLYSVKSELRHRTKVEKTWLTPIFLKTIEKENWILLDENWSNVMGMVSGKVVLCPIAGKHGMRTACQQFHKMQVRQGDQPWYPEDTIESFVGHSSMGFLCPPAWTSWTLSDKGLLLFGTEFDSHTTAQWPVLEVLFGFSEWLCNSRGLRSLCSVK